ncbi:MAG: energy transducer TonB [Vitreimonas sp.]
MRPLVWTDLTVLALISGLLASVAAAQEVPSDGPPLAVGIGPPPAAPSTEALTGVRWMERPDTHDFERLYPPLAWRQGVQAHVVLDCFVDANGRISCSVVSEEPSGYGFGDATLRLARSFRVAPQTTDGRPTQGGRVRIPIVWRLS